MGPRKDLSLFGEVAGHRGGALVVRVGPRTIQATYEGTLDAGAAVSVVLRAESATLHRAVPPDRINAVSGRIAYAVSLGTNAEYEVRLADDSGLRVVEQIPSGVPSFRDGDPVVVAWSPERIISKPRRPTAARFRRRRVGPFRPPGASAPAARRSSPIP